MYDASSNMLSVLNYGLQAPDFSVGRVPNGTGNWTITLPTPSAVNIAASTGNVASLRINEWMASNSKGPDWFEVYNPNAQPVAIGGLVFANDAGFITNATTIRPLSFLGGGGTNGYYQFIADRDLLAGADHVNFKLSAGGDTVALGVPGRVIDSISFTAQAPDISEGRFPDGTATIVRFPGTDSPGESNYRLLTNVVVNEVLAHADPAIDEPDRGAGGCDRTAQPDGGGGEHQRMVAERLEEQPAQVPHPGQHDCSGERLTSRSTSSSSTRTRCLTRGASA